MTFNPEKPTPGTFAHDWKPLTVTRCDYCGSERVEYRTWNSDCGGFEDYLHRCLDCKREWWVEGIDS